VGLLLGLGQFVFGFVVIAQFAAGVYFGLGQIATGVTAIGQIAVGYYVYASMGFGKFPWTLNQADQQAVGHFEALWKAVRGLLR